MKYKGIELNEFKSDTPVVFDPPKKMLVWATDNDFLDMDEVDAYLPMHTFPVKCLDADWQHCAEIPDIPETLKSRRATNYELAMWLALGKGTYKNSYAVFDDVKADCECESGWLICKCGDKEWHEPTVDYMGLED